MLTKVQQTQVGLNPRNQPYTTFWKLQNSDKHIPNVPTFDIYEIKRHQCESTLMSYLNQKQMLVTA